MRLSELFERGKMRSFKIIDGGGMLFLQLLAFALSRRPIKEESDTEIKVREALFFCKIFS